MTFRDFYFDLNGQQRPYHWQERLAEQVAEGEWPAGLALPTASGKTACIDIAVYAMAKQARFDRARRTAPRRIFFVVDRRVIVDEAFGRMRRIAQLLREAKGGVLRSVADELRHLAGDPEADPIVTYQMRGGIYRDRAWIQNPAQPTLIASTVDQVGSRLLFQGYGVSASAKPIHAALVGNDAMILLDEAHCSVPFGETLQRIKLYREQGGIAESLRMPFHVVEMSATPVTGGNVFVLPEDDRAEDFLGKRLRAAKPAELIPVKKSGREALEEELFQNARRLAEIDERIKNVVVFVNRVSSARAVFERLRYKHDAMLMIGRMRPIDRDEMVKKHQVRLKSGAERSTDAEPLFVVATQCLEVGADYDFDALVTECASIDALRQRFGRLNRTGRDGIEGRAVILAPAGKLSDDPIYGDAIHHTWAWLQQHAQNGGTVINFANEGPGTVGEALAEGTPAELRIETKNSPVLFREYLDIWSQTNPAPEPQPDPGYFLHGPDYESDDIQVVWRADLGNSQKDWADIVSLCPPTSPEAMPVSLRAFRKWIRTREEDKNAADIAHTEEREKPRQGKFEPLRFLRWRGANDSKVFESASDVRTGDTVVLPVSCGGWKEFGYIPGNQPQADQMMPRIDRAEEALLIAKRRICLRLHPEVTKHWSVGPSKELEEALKAGEPDSIQEALRGYCERLNDDDWLKPVVASLLTRPPEVLEYSGTNEKCYVLKLRGVVEIDEADIGKRAKTPVQPKRQPEVDEDDGNDDLSAISRVSLQAHTEHVRERVGHFVTTLGLEDLRAEFEAAAEMHDWGKADERFQALLLGGDRFAAAFSPRLWAKGDQMALSQAERSLQRRLSGLPNGFRHEFLSLQLAQSGRQPITGDENFVLHLIASHHGWARPFAPVVIDDNRIAVNLERAGVVQRWSREERSAMTPAHRAGSGVSDRFWRLTRTLGWWGLAYAEAILRLADWSASSQEAANQEKRKAAA